MTTKLDSLLDSLLGKNNWEAYCINLDVAKDRNNSFTNWAQSLGLSFKFWSATDKNSLSPSDYQQCDVIVNNEFKSPGATACRLSHIRLFKYLLSNFPNKEYFFIFEDDCGFKSDSETAKNIKKETLFQYISDVKQYNTNWDSLVFGYHDTGAKQLNPISERLNLVLRSHLAHATIYKRSAMESIIYLHSLPQTRNLPFDWLTDILRDLKSITLGPKTSIIDQIDDFSYILFNYESKKDKNKNSKNNKIEGVNIADDLIRCCVQFPKIVNGKTEFNLNINTMHGDAIFLPHSSIRSFVKNAHHLKNPVVVVAYDLNNKISEEVLREIDTVSNILALYVNSPVYTSNKIKNIDINVESSITYWKKLIDSHKKV
jgi:GR25 family glycosyltransferase involved in LPS biosynthesis